MDDPSDAAYLDPDHVHKARIVWREKLEDGLGRAFRGIGDIDDDTFVWMGGVATGLILVRRYLRHELALTPAHLKVDGYWKRGEAGRDRHAPFDISDPDDETPTSDGRSIHDEAPPTDSAEALR